MVYQSFLLLIVLIPFFWLMPLKNYILSGFGLVSLFTTLFFLGSLTFYLSLNEMNASYKYLDLFGILDFYLYLDSLSGLLILTVLIIGFVIFKYSYRHLEDDQNASSFKKNLCVILSAVLLMILTGNLFWYIAGSAVTSFSLNNLLIHYRDKKITTNAAKKKFWISRISELFLICAAIILFIIFKTLNIDEIIYMANTSDLVKNNIVLINLSVLFILFGIMAQSTIFPFHSWLPNTLDTASPVSALMHAGIINSGGYLIIRFSPFLQSAGDTISYLALFGAFTMLYGTFVMLSQTSIKKSLAFSTLSQMGFMMIQCGLGAYVAATVHIIGHAFYKAYAFLSAGTITDIGRINRYYPKTKIQHDLHTSIFTGLIVFLIVINIIHTKYQSIFSNPGLTFTYLALGMALAHILLNADKKIAALRIGLMITISYLLVTHFMNIFIDYTIFNQTNNFTFTNSIITLFCILAIIIIYFLQTNLTWITSTTFGKKLYIRSLRGGFKWTNY